MSINHDSPFAKKLKYQMNVKGFRARDVIEATKPFEERCGATITRQDMSNYINSYTTPKSKKLILLCKALDVEPEYFTLEDNMSVPNDGLTVEELRLVKGWRKLSDREKDIIRYVIEKHNVVLDDKRMGT